MTRDGATAADLSTPMMKQYMAIKRQHPDAILFFRMGDFYEMFLEDAVKASAILKIALTTRDKGKENAVPMCGVPFHAADSYLTRLVRAGCKVAVCDQVEDPRQARGLVRREVTRVVTPGTAVEDALLTASEPSYLAAVDMGDGQIGVAFLEASTGRFLAAQLEGPDARGKLVTLMEQYSPRETLLSDGDALELPDLFVTRVEKFRFMPEVADEVLREHYGLSTLSGLGMDDAVRARGASGAALWYLKEVLGRHIGHLRHPRLIEGSEGMVLDGTTLRNLEILSSSVDGRREGSLLAVMDRTATAQGARRLREALVHPLRDARGIERRLELVQELVDSVRLRSAIRETLSGISDLERVLARVSAGTAGPRDADAIRSSLGATPALKERLSELDADLGEDLMEGVEDLEPLRELLESALEDKVPASVKDGGVIRRGYDRELDDLKAMAMDGRSFISRLEAQEREATGIPSLKVGYNRVFGYYLEVTNPHRDLVPARYIRKQTLVNAERYVTEELKGMEERILTAQERMAALEKELFEDLKAQVLSFAEPLLRTAQAVADADLFSALAELAHASGYCRPVILESDPSRRLSIAQGRHPVLEKLNLGESFVPNDIYLDSADDRLLVITGPNMAGKSTLMRQVALIAIMAQAGSFVPAKEALISPVDRIFTRVGAADVITRGLSTFMVEMVETARILNSATADSLVILDEIGRGTSTFDGISIAWAVAEHLLNGPGSGCRVLFATHYHELTELALVQPGVRNYNVAIREWGDHLVFLRLLQEGAADKSYGIQVARLAGLPAEVIERSRSILGNLEAAAVDREGTPVLVGTGDEGKGRAEGDRLPQMELFGASAHDLLDRIRTMDTDGMTPIEALNVLADLKRRYG